MRILRALFCAALVLIAIEAQAESARPTRNLKVVGRSSVTVTTPTVRLGDLAEVSSTSLSDDDAVIGLQKIFIENSPAPGRDVTISASSIIEKLTAEGVDLGKVSYVFPRVLTVKRAARLVTKDEVRIAIETALHLAGMDAALKDVRYKEDRFVSPGASSIEAIPLTSSIPGIRPFSVKVAVDGGEQQVFDVNAAVDEWGMLPVARRGVPRGDLIQADDVAMARVNLGAIPVDALHDDGDVVGLSATKDILTGEVFRKDKLAIPPLVVAGAKVTMMYKSGIFEASASGIALESGIRGQEIKIRNDSSKKIIAGVVLEPGLVGVKP